jgi:hypothetical protein
MKENGMEAKYKWSHKTTGKEKILQAVQLM